MYLLILFTEIAYEIKSMIKWRNTTNAIKPFEKVDNNFKIISLNFAINIGRTAKSISMYLPFSVPKYSEEGIIIMSYVITIYAPMNGYKKLNSLL